MSNYNQTHAQGVYPGPPVSSASVEGYGQAAGGYMVPPPAGYPMKDSHQANTASTNQHPVTTQSRGDGFWKGCCAALCCCCVLDACF